MMLCGVCSRTQALALASILGFQFLTAADSSEECKLVLRHLFIIPSDTVVDE